MIKSGQDWNFDMIEDVYIEIKKIADEKYGLNYYPNQLEIITSEQMLDAYSSVGLPLYYSHWSFGEQFVKELEAYKRGRMGLAYEIVINSSPCIAYLMEENNAMMQALVIAHASFGHNHFFKNNYLFKQWTDAEGIIDYLAFAKKYIRKCEDLYGVDEVEAVLDACHALQQYGVDKYSRPEHLSAAKEEKLRKEREDYIQANLNEIWKTVPRTVGEEEVDEEPRFPAEPHENILYFIEKNAPRLDDWKREIVRIVRKISQYFYPQRQCLTGNHIVSTKKGLIRLNKLITDVGYIENDKIEMLTTGNKFTPTSHVYKKQKQHVMRVTTQSGRVFTGTPEHPLSTLDETTNNTTLTEIQDMTVGNHLVFSVGYDNCFADDMVSLVQPEYSEVEHCKICGFESAFLSTHLTQTHGITINEYKNDFNIDYVSSGMHRYNKSANKIKKYPEYLSAEVGELIAYIICNKPYANTNQTFDWSYNDIDLAYHAQILLKNVMGIEVDVKLDKFGMHRLKFNSFDLYEFLIANFGSNILSGVNISVPDEILSSPKAVCAAFIRGIVDNKSTRRSNISSFELNFNVDDIDTVDAISTVLIGMGIVVEIKKQHRTSIVTIAKNMNIDVTGIDDIQDGILLRILPLYKPNFESEIGTIIRNIDGFTGKLRGSGCAVIPNAKELLDEVIMELQQNKKEHISNIPNFNKLSYNEKFKHGLLLKQQTLMINVDELYDNRGESITIGDYRTHLEKFNNLKLLNNDKATKLLKYLEDSNDLYYDKIVKIELLEELHDVYDVTIPENHLFYVDGIISHNTQVMNEGCLVEGSKITTENGLMDIKTLVETKFSGRVWDGDKWETVYDWFTHEDKPRIRIVTNKGYEIHSGYDHRIKIADSWSSASSVKVGDIIDVSPLSSHEWPVDEPKLNIPKPIKYITEANACKMFGVSVVTYWRFLKDPLYADVMINNNSEKCRAVQEILNGNSASSRMQSKHIIPLFPTKMSPDLAKWLGYLIGDGNVSSRSRVICLTSGDHSMVIDFEKLTHSIFGEHINVVIRKDDNRYRAIISNQEILSFITTELSIKIGKSSSIKEIPKQVFLGTKESVVGFLQGYFDADGCATKDGRVILVSNSKKLVSGVQDLLLHFNIFCSYRIQKDNTYHLVIGGINALYYKESIGFGLERKQSRLSILDGRKFLPRKTKCVVERIEIDNGTTYDFSVSNSHQYYHKGMINHNCATFFHHKIMHDLHEQGELDDGAMMEFYASHTNVIFQPAADSDYYSGINPYAIGFAMYQDIERVSMNPTDEDREWFGKAAEWVGNGEWLKNIKWAIENFKDESFIQQFLSPKVIRDMKMFAILDDELDPKYMVSGIHNKQGYKTIRTALSNQYNIGYRAPDIQVYDVDRWGDRSLTLRHYMVDKRPLESESTTDTLRCVSFLWGYNVRLESVDHNEEVRAIYDIAGDETVLDIFLEDV